MDHSQRPDVHRNRSEDGRRLGVAGSQRQQRAAAMVFYSTHARGMATPVDRTLGKVGPGGSAGRLCWVDRQNCQANCLCYLTGLCGRRVKEDAHQRHCHEQPVARLGFARQIPTRPESALAPHRTARRSPRQCSHPLRNFQTSAKPACAYLRKPLKLSPL